MPGRIGKTCLAQQIHHFTMNKCCSGLSFLFCALKNIIHYSWMYLFLFNSEIHFFLSYSSWIIWTRTKLIHTKNMFQNSNAKLTKLLRKANIGETCCILTFCSSSSTWQIRYISVILHGRMLTIYWCSMFISEQ